MNALRKWTGNRQESYPLERKCMGTKVKTNKQASRSLWEVKSSFLSRWRLHICEKLNSVWWWQLNHFIPHPILPVNWSHFQGRMTWNIHLPREDKAPPRIHVQTPWEYRLHKPHSHPKQMWNKQWQGRPVWWLAVLLSTAETGQQKTMYLRKRMSLSVISQVVAGMCTTLSLNFF